MKKQVTMKPVRMNIEQPGDIDSSRSDQSQLEDDEATVKIRSKRVKSSDDMAEKTLYGTSAAWNERLYQAVNKDTYLPEVFKIIRSRILHPREEQKDIRTIMVTSAAPKEGKSFITANLGISLAQGMEQHSLLVNCDLRRPSLASMFGLDGRKGLVDYLRDHQELSDLIQKTTVAKLSVLPSGRPPINPAELLGSARMSDLVDELSRRYEDRIIIFDSPPVQVASETLVLSNLVDAVLLVVSEGGASRMQVQKLVEDIGRERIIGVVFNNYTSNIIERSLMRGYGGYGGTRRLLKPGGAYHHIKPCDDPLS